MSGDLETIRRLHAWHAGRPIDRGSVLNVHVAADRDAMVVAFVRMGGESRPWGVAIGTLADGPRVVTVPEARNRDLVADMMLEVAPVLLGHFRHPNWSDEGPGGFQTQSLRQLWLPGPTHVEMLQFVAAAYARTRWERPDVDSLRALGNLCNALFLEVQRPGQQMVMSATDALRSAHVFPTSSVRQGHLDHLLGWLVGEGDRDVRAERAHSAEKRSVSTVLDPETERRDIEPLVSAWGVDRSDETARTIHRVLSTELERRWSITASAIDVLRRDPRLPNSHLSTLVDKTAKSFYRSWGERVLNEAAGLPPFWSNVFTDRNARGAAGSYHARVADHDEARLLLMHGDRELQREELASGKGAIVTIESVSADEWIVAYEYPEFTTIEAGKSLTIAGRPKMRLKVRDVDTSTRRMTLEPGWKRAKSSAKHEWASHDSRWISGRLVLLPDSPTQIAWRKIEAARASVDIDITALLHSPPARHAAFDDDGVVAETVEVES